MPEEEYAKDGARYARSVEQGEPGEPKRGQIYFPLHGRGGGSE